MTRTTLVLKLFLEKNSTKSIISLRKSVNVSLCISKREIGYFLFFSSSSFSFFSSAAKIGKRTRIAVKLHSGQEEGMPSLWKADGPMNYWTALDGIPFFFYFLFLLLLLLFFFFHSFLLNKSVCSDILMNLFVELVRVERMINDFVSSIHRLNKWLKIEW